MLLSAAARGSYSRSILKHTEHFCDLQEAPPKEDKVKVDEVQVLPVTPHVTAFRSIATQRLKFEIEYGLKRGTTDNSYLVQVDKFVGSPVNLLTRLQTTPRANSLLLLPLQEGKTVVLIDLPDQTFTDDFSKSAAGRAILHRLHSKLRKSCINNDPSTERQL